ncbi:MAG: TAXI family TRAP transporter solute-binding subunit, partial [Pseudomonadota bacterium]
DGITLELIATAGSVENAGLLASGAADIGLLQGGVPAAPELKAIGALFVEPIFLFQRRDAPVPDNPGAWEGLRLASGAQGSGTRAAMLALLEAAGVPVEANRLLPISGKEAVAALRAGEADLAVFVAPIAAPYLGPLFADPDFTLLELRHIHAISRRLAQADLVTLHAGAIRLSPPIPAQDVTLMAMIARLAAQSELHPAMVDRLVEAAREIHGTRDALTDEGAFPSMEHVAMRADLYARDLIASGPSPLQEYLPYWVVAQINRFAILLLPILFLLIPVLRVLPGLYAWRMRSRVWRHYQEIREIDRTVMDSRDPEALDSMRTRLDAIDAEIASLALPLAYRDYAYQARLHIDLLRGRIAERRASAGA